MVVLLFPHLTHTPLFVLIFALTLPDEFFFFNVIFLGVWLALPLHFLKIKLSPSQTLSFSFSVVFGVTGHTLMLGRFWALRFEDRYLSVAHLWGFALYSGHYGAHTYAYRGSHPWPVYAHHFCLFRGRGTHPVMLDAQGILMALNLSYFWQCAGTIWATRVRIAGWHHATALPVSHTLVVLLAYLTVLCPEMAHFVVLPGPPHRQSCRHHTWHRWEAWGIKLVIAHLQGELLRHCPPQTPFPSGLLF